MKLALLILVLLCIFNPLVYAEKLTFSGSRYIEWADNGEILLKDANNKLITKLSLLAKAKKNSGASSLGLDVEETDLGGETSSKTYLKNKRVVHGKQLDSSVGSIASDTIDIKNVETANIAGTSFKKTYFQNGAYAYQINWGVGSAGAETEEVYFDAKGNLRYNKKSQKISQYTKSRTVWVDGSISEQYQNAQGAVNHTIDSQDNTSRFAFSNSGNEVLSEVSCDLSSCEVE